MVDGVEAVHHRLADHVGANFVAPSFQLPLNAGYQALDLGRIDVAFAAGMAYRTLQLGAVERFALAVLLDHRQVAQLDPLEGGEARPAAFALAAAADRGAVLARAAVFYLAVL